MPFTAKKEAVCFICGKKINIGEPIRWKKEQPFRALHEACKLTKEEEASRRTLAIASLNDAARRAPGVLCRTVCTSGIRALEESDQCEIMEKVAAFDTFTKENDPWGEHDFGKIEHNGERIFWKFDYYDKDLAYHSPDPADASVTVRVLTIMLASEY